MRPFYIPADITILLQKTILVLFIFFCAAVFSQDSTTQSQHNKTVPPSTGKQSNEAVQAGPPAEAAVEESAGEAKRPIPDTAVEKAEENQTPAQETVVTSERVGPATPEDGCMDEIETQNIEVVTCNEILGADSDVSLRATIVNGRAVIDDLKKRLENCDKEYSRVYIGNAIRRIESAIRNAQEEVFEKKSMARLNSVNDQKNLLLQQFDSERVKGRPDFKRLQKLLESFKTACGPGDLSDSAGQVVRRMEKVIRRRGTAVGEDVISRLDICIENKNVSVAEKELGYLLENARYLRLLDLTVSPMELDHYTGAVIKIGGTVAALSENNAPGKRDPVQKVEIRTESRTAQMEEELRGNGAVSTKLKSKKSGDVMADFKDLDVEEPTGTEEPSAPASFTDLIMKAGEAKKAAKESADSSSNE